LAPTVPPRIRRLGKIHHVAIVVRSIDGSLPLWRDLLGLDLEEVMDIPTDRVRIAFLGVGESKVELVEPTDDTTGVARFLESKGEGFHHVCFEVDNLAEALIRAGAINRFVAKQLPTTFNVRGNRDAGIGAEEVTLVDARFCGGTKDASRGKFVGVLRPAGGGTAALPALDGSDCRGKLDEVAKRLAAAPDAGSVAVVELVVEWVPTELRVSIGDRFELIKSDVCLWLENDDRWISPAPGGRRTSGRSRRPSRVPIAEARAWNGVDPAGTDGASSAASDAGATRSSLAT